MSRLISEQGLLFEKDTPGIKENPDQKEDDHPRNFEETNYSTRKSNTRYLITKDNGTIMFYDVPPGGGRIILPNGDARDLQLPEDKETIKMIKEKGESFPNIEGWDNPKI